MSRPYIGTDIQPNEEFVSTIKQKYARVGSISPNKRKWPREGVVRDRAAGLAAAEGEKEIGLNDYQSIRSKYEDKKQVSARAEGKRADLPSQAESEWRGTQTHTSSSPIKILQEHNTNKIDNFLSARRSEIDQLHLQRANTQK